MKLERKSTEWLLNKLRSIELTPPFRLKVNVELDKREAANK